MLCCLSPVYLAVPHGKRILTAEELEASMGAKTSAKSSQEASNSGLHRPPGIHGTPPFGLGADPKHSLSFTSAPVIPTGKVTTVAELEADFKEVKLKDVPGGKLPIQLGNQQAPVAVQAKLMQAAGEQKPTATDMAAFNRLLGMIQKASESVSIPALCGYN